MTGAGEMLAAFICVASEATDAGGGDDVLGAGAGTAAATESDLFHPENHTG